jgi:hypothetical protein
MALIIRRLRVSAVASRSARLFSAASEPPESVSDDSPAGGWYSASSIEARVKTRRKRASPDASGGTRTPTKLSDEDYYLAAGAPGYTEEDLRHRTVAPSKALDADASSRTKPLDGATSASPPPRAPAPPQASPMPLQRRTSFSLPLSALPGFLAAWRLKAAPVFSTAKGGLGATLLVGGVPPGATLASLLATSRTAARASRVAVEIASTWADPATMERCHATEGYTGAMAALAAFVETGSAGSSGSGEGLPTTEHWTVLSDAPAAASAASAPAPAADTGDELGLR